MSDINGQSRKRKDLLKQLILQLHEGAAPEDVRGQLVRLIGTIPYREVVEVEQELISGGLPTEEVLHLCDVHSAALRGQIDLTGMKAVPPGHPVDTFTKENEALERLIATMQSMIADLRGTPAQDDSELPLSTLRGLLAQLWDVDKHYRRKENLLFPFLEKQGITGPPTVMWGKHDQIRALLKSALEALSAAQYVSNEEAIALCDLLLKPATDAVLDMIMKESQILFPMCLDVVEDAEWFEIAEHSPEIGFCLYDPVARWIPEDVLTLEPSSLSGGRVVMPTGSFTLSELSATLNTLPVDLTFVDHEDTVRYFSQGRERIFDRNRTIIGRKVQLCHPPTSVHIVNQILDDFRSGRQDRAEFWITLQGKFVYISYYAVRGDSGEYLGTVEMTMNLTPLRKLDGERRLLNYEPAGDPSHV